MYDKHEPCVCWSLSKAASRGTHHSSRHGSHEFYKILLMNFNKWHEQSVYVRGTYTYIVRDLLSGERETNSGTANQDTKSQDTDFCPSFSHTVLSTCTCRGLQAFAFFSFRPMFFFQAHLPRNPRSLMHFPCSVLVLSSPVEHRDCKTARTKFALAPPAQNRCSEQHFRQPRPRRRYPRC